MTGEAYFGTRALEMYVAARILVDISSGFSSSCEQTVSPSVALSHISMLA